MKNLYDIIIIGAGPAGVSAAIYTGRAKLKTLIIDSGESGGQIRITSEVVNYPGLLSVSGAQLSDTMRKQAESFGAKIIHARVEEMALQGDLKTIRTDKEEYKALGVILATGARPRTLGFEGEKEFKGRGIGYCATCDGEFFTGKDVFVIGGGFAAAEEAIFLTRYAKKVYIMVREQAFTCSQTIVDKVMANPQIEVRFNTEIVSADGDQVLKKATFRSNATGESWVYQPENPADTFGIFVFVGYEPMSGFVKGQIELDEMGYIPTNNDLMTNVPGVYAAGDIRPKRLRQLVTAVSDGAVAATGAEHYVTEKKAALGIVIEQDKQEKTDAPGILDGELAQQLAPVFERFNRDVILCVIRDSEDPASGEMSGLAEGLAALSSHIKVKLLEKGEDSALEQKLGATGSPSLSLLDAGGTPLGITYRAVPGGHEFNSFVLALYNAAGPGQEVAPELLERIKALRPVRLQAGVTLSCTMCPDLVQASQLAAINNQGVSLEIIDVGRDGEFRNKYNIMSVPALVTSGGKVSFGKKSLEELVSYLEREGA